jgi:S-adenosylmethionine hydrolase
MRTFGPVITLTTDFGTADGYTGVVKGVILSKAPHGQIVDISHQIEAWNIRSASWVITSAYKYFPAGTVHMVVVDPQVGSMQRRILLKGAQEIFLAPDNGVLSSIIDEQSNWTVYELDKRDFWLPYVSSTFHARDIFAPVAAHLISGIQASELGTEISLDSLARLDATPAESTVEGLSGLVVHVDRFGNLITNIPNNKIRPHTHCYLDGKSIGELQNTYSSVSQGHAAAFPASHGYIEIALHQGRAADVLKASTGAQVKLRFTAE